MTRRKTLYKILKTAGELGVQQNIPVYAVGGIARDLILNRPIKDVDISVIGNGVSFAYMLAAALKVSRIVPFDKFGTAVIPYKHLNIEVVTARSETYRVDSRKPHVTPADLKSDLSRRDFTINTMAFSLLPENFGELIDLFDGQGDLKRKIIRTPLDPEVTFSEDPLRMLRAIRFATTLGFSIDPVTLGAIRKVKDRLAIISMERIRDEIMKILASERPSVGFILMKDTGLLKLIMPEIETMAGMEQRSDHHHKDIFLHTLQVLDNTASMTDKTELRFAALVHDIAKPVTRKFKPGTGWTFHGHEYVGMGMIEDLGRRLRLPVKMIKYAKKLTRLHLRPIALVDDGVTDSAIRRLMVDAGDEINDLMLLCRADITSHDPKRVAQYKHNFEKVALKMKIVEEKDTLRAFKSPVSGEEIMKVCHIKPGPLVGFIKHLIEESILNGEIPNDYEAAREYFLKSKDRWIAEFEKNKNIKKSRTEESR